MPRQPAQLVGGKGLRQRMWERIRLLSQLPTPCNFSVMDLLYGAEIDSADTAREYITGLFHAGYLDLRAVAVTTGPAARRTPARYSLAKDAGIDAPRVRKDGTPVTMGMAQEQMWRTLRMLKDSNGTNARELAAHAGTPAIPVAMTAARDYLFNLHKAGYLLCTAAGKGMGKGGIQARYRLKPAANTGPRAPMVCRTQVLYDPNTDQTHAIERVTEEVAIYGK